VFGLCCTCWGFGLPPDTRAAAEEPVEAFLEGVRARGMYDVALDYLDYLATSPLADASTRQLLPYHRGVTLVAGARSERDITLRMRQLAEAESQFQQFLVDVPDHPRAGSASTRLGGVLTERGRAQYDMSERADSDADGDASLQQSRTLYGDAGKVLDAAIVHFEQQLAALPKFIDNRDEQRADARQQIRLDLADARLSAAGVLRETARTYANDNASQRDKLLQQAAERYQTIFDDAAYRSKPVRWYARLQQGWCYEELGRLDDALVACDELLVLPSEPETLGRLKAETMHLAMTCWLDARSRNLDEAIAKGTSWLESLGDEQKQSSQATAVRWLTSEALAAKAESTDDEQQRDAWQQAALALADEVAAQPGPNRGKARALLAAHRVQSDASEQKLFADALAEGERLLESVREQEKTAENADERAAVLDSAIRLLRQSLELAPREAGVKTEDLNRARYYLCFALYQAEQFYDAAVIGEFLASRYAVDPQARSSARIALFALWSAYDRAAEDDREFELGRMSNLARLIAEKWPQLPEASEAWMLLGDVALAAGDINAAIQHYANIADDSPSRALADLRTGRAIWIQLIRTSTAVATGGDSDAGDADAGVVEPGDTKPEDAEPGTVEPVDTSNTAARLTQARTLLERGVTAMRQQVEGGAAVTRDLAIGELSLAQVHLHAGDVDAAIESLTRGKDSVVELLSSNHEVTRHPGFTTEAYKTLLRARIAARDFEGAEEVMAGLDRAIADGRIAEDAVTRIYLGLGRELENELVRLQATDDGDQLAQVRESFEQFLERVAKRPETHTFGSLLWVGDTYIRLGAGMGDDSSQLARRYYADASKALSALLARGETEADFAPSAESIWAVRIKLAECKRREGDYRGAVRELVNVLKQRPNLLTAQVDAARTYQAWGEKDPAKYVLAVRGDKKARRKDRQTFNLIRGWAKLGNVLQSSTDHRDLYYEARYRQAESWYAAAQAAQGDEKLRNLQLAASTLLATHRLTPLETDNEWYARYDRLLKLARQASGESAVGLSAASAKRG
jgi:hypothetical protein